MMFYVGQPVIRVTEPRDEYTKRHIRMGWVYWIKEILRDGTPNEFGGIDHDDGFLFYGIPDGEPNSGYFGWDARDYRPLDEGDISLLAQKHKIKEKME